MNEGQRLWHRSVVLSCAARDAYEGLILVTRGKPTTDMTDEEYAVYQAAFAACEAEEERCRREGREALLASAALGWPQAVEHLAHLRKHGLS